MATHRRHGLTRITESPWAHLARQRRISTAYVAICTLVALVLFVRTHGG